MITWWMYAIFASLIWGVHYNLVAKSMTIASPITIYAIPNILLFITLPFWYKILIKDFHSIMASGWDMKVTVVIQMFTCILGTIAAYQAIHSSNATMASLIEITYPIFVAIFAILIFNENHFTWPIAFGGGLIMSGVGVLIYFNG
jgi:drug/metabolite transporter (DMT)-like permease